MGLSAVNQSVRPLVTQSHFIFGRHACLFASHSLVVLSLLIIRLSNLLFHRNVGEAWIGYSDITNEGHWEWTNPSGRCDKYTHWRRGEPNNSWNNEDCGAIVKSWNGQWNDAKCSSKYSFVCEIGRLPVRPCVRGEYGDRERYDCRYTELSNSKNSSWLRLK